MSKYKIGDTVTIHTGGMGIMGSFFGKSGVPSENKLQDSIIIQDMIIEHLRLKIFDETIEERKSIVQKEIIDFIEYNRKNFFDLYYKFHIDSDDDINFNIHTIKDNNSEIESSQTYINIISFHNSIQSGDFIDIELHLDKLFDDYEDEEYTKAKDYYLSKIIKEEKDEILSNIENKDEEEVKPIKRRRI